MKLCTHCNLHNQIDAQTCHFCNRTLGAASSKKRKPLRTAILLGVVTTGVIMGCGEAKYGVPEVDNDGDGFASIIDCDDSDPAVGAEELRYLDADGDGFGDVSEVSYFCEEEEGWVIEAGDCDDENTAIHPDAEETPGDGVDSNCNDLDDE